MILLFLSDACLFLSIFLITLTRTFMRMLKIAKMIGNASF